MFGQLNHFSRRKGAEHAYAQERYRGITVRLLQVLDQRLQAHAWLAGDAYGVADVATYHWAGYVDVYGMDWGDYPHLARWRGAIAARPAAQRETAALARLATLGRDMPEEASRENMDRFWWRA